MRNFWTILEKRKSYFKQFQTEGKISFESFHKNYQKLRPIESQKLDDVYAFTVCAKGRWGGNDDGVFQVFYGNRISGHIEGTETLDDGKTKHYFKNFIESGVELSFWLNEQGLVDVYISAAKDSYTGVPKMEDGIVVKRLLNPKKLLRKCVIRKYWRILFSYMEYTCSLGNPNFFDKLRYYWYINHKGYVVKDGKIERRQFASNLLRVFIYLITTIIGVLTAIGVAFLVYKFGW